MGRGKLNMELISNDKSRMITYHKRKKGLTKKVQEFQILCDVDACIVIFGPKFNNRPVDIETWPTDCSEMRRIISKYRSQGNDRKKNQDLSHFFVTRKKKVDDDIAKMRKACVEAKYPVWDNRIKLLQFHELGVLASVLESKIEVATSRILKIKGEVNHYFSVDSKLGIMQINNNIRQNPMATTFANALAQKNLELEAYNKRQPFSCKSQIDHHISSHDQMLQLLNVNPVNSSTLMMMMAANGNGNDDDYLNRFCGESSSERGCSVVKDVAYCDPPTSHHHHHQMQMVGNMMVLNNNPSAHPVSYSCSGLNRHLPMLPYRQDSLLMPNASSHQARFPQFSDFFDIDEFQMTDNK